MQRHVPPRQNASTLGRAVLLNRPRVTVSARSHGFRRGMSVVAFEDGSVKDTVEEKATNINSVPITLSVPLKVNGFLVLYLCKIYFWA